jgi:hypothetical protein
MGRTVLLLLSLEVQNPSKLNDSPAGTNITLVTGMRTGDSEGLAHAGGQHSTRWHSQSRKSPLLLSQEL